MKSIYYNGHIIEGVEEQTGTDLVWVNSNQYKSIPVIGEHNWEDEQGLVIDVDYKISCHPSYKTCMCRDAEKCEHEVCIPLTPKEN